MRLITSAAYVGQELSAEFGEIPPAFLPVGVARLYEAQIARLGPERPIYLTIPESFTPQPHDQRRLHDLGVVLLPVPEGLRLGESVVYAMNSIDMPPGPIQILHGDTLIDDLPDGAPDLIAVHAEGDDYSWAAVDLDGDQVVSLEEIAAGSGRDDPRSVACGFFGFASGSALVRAITRARGDFIGGLNLYARERPMRAAEVRTWYDFGHIQTYFRSRRAITTARAFCSTPCAVPPAAGGSISGCWSRINPLSSRWPVSTSIASTNSTPSGADSTSRSRSGQSGSAASKRRNWLHSTARHVDMPREKRPWPERAASPSAMAARSGGRIVRTAEPSVSMVKSVL